MVAVRLCLSCISALGWVQLDIFLCYRLCYPCKKSLGFVEDKAAALAWKATAEDWESPLDEDYIKSAVKTARKEYAPLNLHHTC